MGKYIAQVLLADIPVNHGARRKLDVSARLTQLLGRFDEKTFHTLAGRHQVLHGKVGKVVLDAPKLPMFPKPGGKEAQAGWPSELGLVDSRFSDPRS